MLRQQGLCPVYAALNILKGFDLKAMGHNSPEYIHVVTEALKLSMPIATIISAIRTSSRFRSRG
jgi:gamma-glutamyltranspeptidase